MTIAPERTEPGEQASVPVSRTGAEVWRNARGFLIIGAIVLAAAVIAALLAARGPLNSGRFLDPADTSLVGSGALAELLRGQGVTVTRATTVDEVAKLAGPDSLIMVSTPDHLLAATDAERLAALPADRVIIGAGPYLNTFAAGVESDDSVRTRSREPGCALPPAARAGSAFIGGAVYEAPTGAVGCYLADGKPTLVQYTVSTATGPRQVTLIGDGSFMTNQRLADDGNAALAMNLAGQRPTLLWLTPPAPGDPGYHRRGTAGPSGRSVTDLIPGGVGWAVVQLAIAVLLVAYWRGRRLGPVVIERLPVIVRAAETVEGHGRLYRARRARDRASAALRAAWLDRVTPRLGLPTDATPDELIAAVVVRTGADAAELSTTLYGPPPRDDAALVRLAGQLDTLEDQVLRGVSHETGVPNRPGATDGAADGEQTRPRRPQ